MRIESAEKPKLVFDNRPTNVNAGVDFRKAFGNGTGERDVLDVAHQAFGSEIRERITTKFITTALGDDVEDAACGAAVFCTVRTGLDLNFLNKLERKVRA